MYYIQIEGFVFCFVEYLFYRNCNKWHNFEGVNFFTLICMLYGASGRVKILIPEQK